MARSPGIAGTLDIRSAGILQDVVYASNPCAPGIKRWKKMLHIFGADAIREIQDHSLHRIQLRRRNYDGPKDWLALLASTIIIGVILGIIQSYALFIPTLVLTYRLGIVDSVLTGAASYALLILFTPASALFVQCMGHRITCILGIILFFTGIVLLALQLHYVIVYVAHIVLMGIGGSLAYTGALTVIVDRFRKHLLVALILLSIGSPMGTAGIQGIVTLMYTYIDSNPYRWSLLVLGILVLLSLLATFSFPTRIAPRLKNSTPGVASGRGDRLTHENVRACIEQSVLRTMPGSRSNSRALARSRSGRSRSGRRSRSGGCVPPRPPCASGESSGGGSSKGEPTRPVRPQHWPKLCFCVIHCDVSVLSDMSFLLWACITFFSALSSFIPQMFILFFAAMLEVSPDPPSLLMFAYCYASLFGRLITMVSSNHKFIYNRIVFQVAMLASGITYLVFSMADTKGWIIIWTAAVGLWEGILSTVIPRVSLQTIPRPWIVSSWVYIILINGFGLFIGVAIVLSIWITTRSMTLGLGCIGVGQLIAAFMSFLLPNEEPDIPEPKEKCQKNKPTIIRSHSRGGSGRGGRGRGRGGRNRSSSYGPGGGGFDDNFSLSSYGNDNDLRSDRSGSRYDSYVSTSAKFGSSDGDEGGGSGGGSGGSSGRRGYSYVESLGLKGMSISKSYLTECPICTRIGCIPGCCECVPGGLTTAFKGVTGSPEDCGSSNPGSSSASDTEQMIPFSSKPAASSSSSASSPTR